MSDRYTEQVSPLDRLVVLRGTLEGTVVGALQEVLASDPCDAVRRTRAYAKLASMVLAGGDTSLREQVLSALLEDRNAFTEAMREGQEPSRRLRAALESDLRNVEMACETSAEELKGQVPDVRMLPDIEMGNHLGFVAEYYRNLRIDERAISQENMTGQETPEPDSARARLVRWLKN